jgi:hypothetical protein
MFGDDNYTRRITGFGLMPSISKRTYVPNIPEGLQVEKFFQASKDPKLSDVKVLTCIKRSQNS